MSAALGRSLRCSTPNKAGAAPARTTASPSISSQPSPLETQSRSSMQLGPAAKVRLGRRRESTEVAGSDRIQPLRDGITVTTERFLPPFLLEGFSLCRARSAHCAGTGSDNRARTVQAVRRIVHWPPRAPPRARSAKCRRVSLRSCNSPRQVSSSMGPAARPRSN